MRGKGIGHEPGRPPQRRSRGGKSTLARVFANMRSRAACPMSSGPRPGTCRARQPRRQTARGFLRPWARAAISRGGLTLGRLSRRNEKLIFTQNLSAAPRGISTRISPNQKQAAGPSAGHRCSAGLAALRGYCLAPRNAPRTLAIWGKLQEIRLNKRSQSPKAAHCLALLSPRRL